MMTDLLTNILLSIASALLVGLIYAAASWLMAKFLVVESRMLKGLVVPALTPWIAVPIRRLYPDPEAFRRTWANYDSRSALVARLASPPRMEPRGLTVMARAAGGESDPLDWLCRLAYGTPLQSRRARALWVRSTHSDFFARFSSQAQAVLYRALTRYVGTLSTDEPAAVLEPATILPDILSLEP